MKSFLNQAELSKRFGFWGLIGLQFQSAFTYYVFMNALVLYLLKFFDFNEERVYGWKTLMGALFAVPYLIFSGAAGALSNRLSKRLGLLFTKAAEIVVLAISAGGLYLLQKQHGSSYSILVAGVVVLFLLATQSAFYGPNRYGILAEILPPERLTWANGMLETASLLAVLFGLIGGTAAFNLLGGRLEWIAALLAGLGLLGMASGWLIEKVPPAKPKSKIARNQFPELWANLKIIMSDRVVFLTVMGISFYWGLVALTMVNVDLWGRFDLGIPVPKSIEEVTLRSVFYSPPILGAVLCIGTGLGCILVGNLCKKGIELGFVPLGGLGIAFFAFWMGLARPVATEEGLVHAATPTMLTAMVGCLLMMGFCAGFYIVPLNALLQTRVDRESRGGVLAAMNFINFSLILVTMGFYGLLTGPFKFTPSNIFTLYSVITFGSTVYLITLLPEALLGLVTTLVTRFLFRIHPIGVQNIPAKGPALLVSNHVSMADALLIMAVSPRPVRFIVWKEIFDNPALGYFLKIMKAIPVSGDQRPRALMFSLTQAADALNRGELVCVFAEGQVTRAGLALPFRRGFRHILTKAPVPVVPVYLEGVWGSIFRYERKRFEWRWPRQLPYHVQVAVGKPLPHDVSAHDMRQSVNALSVECAMAKKGRMQPVHHRFIKHARAHKTDFCLADATTPPLKYWKAVVGSIILARKLRKHWKDQPMVGIFMPPTVGGAIANSAAAFAGRTAVNLNYTTGPDVLNHCIKQCNIQTIVTARVFIAKLGIEAPPGSIFLDELRKEKTPPWENLLAIAAFLFFPIRWIETICGATKHPTPDDLMTVIFSSGSTGIPKGVMLSHFNVLSNIESIETAVSLWTDDRLIGFLPFFHSFGYTVALWGAYCIGFGVVHHPNPLEPKQIGDLVEKHKCTVMIATPTFLQHYTRKIDAEKFASMEFVLTGAEKLPLRIAEAFEEKFGVYVHEGYGTTECAPVVSCNVDEYRSRGQHQHGNKRGSVGHPVPGVHIEIRDVETHEIMPGGESGMVYVRGANIMQGYLDLKEKTEEVLKDGWYETGDLGYLDDEGFLHITDRLSRFSKIGGEMVPHVRIEQELHEAAGISDQVFVVTSIPDDLKGERLVVLHTVDSTQVEGIGEKLSQAGLPNLWIPRPNMFFKVDAIPVLGSGKLDLAEIRRTALRLTEAEPVGAGK